MFPAETTLAQDGSLVSSDIWPFHFRESDRSTLSVNFKNGQAFLLASCLKSKRIICFNKQFSNLCLRQNIKHSDERRSLNCEYWLYFVENKVWTNQQEAGLGLFSLVKNLFENKQERKGFRSMIASSQFSNLQLGNLAIWQLGNLRIWQLSKKCWTHFQLWQLSEFETFNFGNFQFNVKTVIYGRNI